MSSIIAFILFLSVPQAEGLFYIYSPQTTPRGSIGFDITLTGSSTPYSSITTEHTHIFFFSDFFFTYGLSDYFEIFAKPVVHYRIATYTDKTYSTLGVPTLELGTSLYTPFQIHNSILNLGFRPSVTICAKRANISTDDKNLIKMGFYPLPNHAPDYSFSLLCEYKIGKFSSLLNLGYVIRGEPYSSSENNRSSGLEIGAGIGIQASPSLVLSSGVLFSENGKKIFISPQVNLRRSFGTIQFGIHISISDFDFVPDSQIHNFPAIGLRFITNTKALGHKTEWVVKIEGTVVDSLTYEPIDTDVEIYGPEVGWLRSDRNTGKFSFVLQKSGAYRISVSKDGYYSVTKVAKLMPYDSVFCWFALERILETSIKGRVLDTSTGRPIYTTVSLIGERRYDTKTDSLTGEYDFWVETGAYNLVVDKKKYIKKVIPIFITNKSSITLDIELDVLGNNRSQEK